MNMLLPGFLNAEFAKYYIVWKDRKIGRQGLIQSRKCQVQWGITRQFILGTQGELSTSSRACVTRRDSPDLGVSNGFPAPSKLPDRRS